MHSFNVWFTYECSDVINIYVPEMKIILKVFFLNKVLWLEIEKSFILILHFFGDPLGNNTILISMKRYGNKKGNVFIDVKACSKT